MDNTVESTDTLSATLAESTLTESIEVESAPLFDCVAELLHDVAKLNATKVATKNKIFFICLQIKFKLFYINRFPFQKALQI